MSECVVRMEMPSNCERCPMCGTASGGNGRYELWCMCGDIPASSWRRPKDCPIICSLPKGHGRLADKDEMLKKIENYHRYMTVGRESDPRCIIEDSATIVPAERSETE